MKRNKGSEDTEGRQEENVKMKKRSKVSKRRLRGRNLSRKVKKEKNKIR
jgi:hypothetical protein